MANCVVCSRPLRSSANAYTYECPEDPNHHTAMAQFIGISRQGAKSPPSVVDAGVEDAGGSQEGEVVVDPVTHWAMLIESHLALSLSEPQRQNLQTCLGEFKAQLAGALAWEKLFPPNSAWMEPKNAAGCRFYHIINQKCGDCGVTLVDDHQAHVAARVEHGSLPPGVQSATEAIMRGIGVDENGYLLGAPAPTPCNQCGTQLDARDVGHACWRCGKKEWK